MKSLIQNISFKIKILGFFSVICLLFLGMIFICEHHMKKGLYDQQMAERWSKEGNASQISAFFSDGAVEDVNYFRGIEQSVDKALQMASIVNENENARLWIDAISKSGKVTLTSPRGNVEVKALGVSGEFFQFHPQKLIYGSLFRQDSMMQDGVVIDEETAWQLFGSSDVAGMQIMIGQVPHFITGVIERPEGRLAKAAGLEKSVCYLSLESLQTLGKVNGGFTYEIVMPNPIKNFALSTMQTAVGADNEDVVLVENSTRFHLIPLFHILQDFGIRSMSFKDIVYPYWENIARGQEDIFALLLLIKSILLILPCIFVIIVIIYMWKNRTWHLKQGIIWVQDKVYEAGTRRVQKKEKQLETSNHQGDIKIIEIDELDEVKEEEK